MISPLFWVGSPLGPALGPAASPLPSAGLRVLRVVLCTRPHPPVTVTVCDPRCAAAAPWWTGGSETPTVGGGGGPIPPLPTCWGVKRLGSGMWGWVCVSRQVHGFPTGYLLQLRLAHGLTGVCAILSVSCVSVAIKIHLKVIHPWGGFPLKLRGQRPTQKNHTAHENRAWTKMEGKILQNEKTLVSGSPPRQQTSGEIIPHARPPRVFRCRWVFGSDRKHTWFNTVINSHLVRLFRSVPIVSSESIPLEGFRVLFSVFFYRRPSFPLPGGKFLRFLFF